MSDDASSSSRSWWKWLLYGLGGLVALVLIAAVALPQLFPPERLKKLVVPQVEKAVNRTVEIESIGLRVLPFPAVRVSQFTIANAEGFGEEPAVEGRALNVDVALWPLFTGTIEPTSVELVEPVVRYQIAEDGSTNFDTFGAADTTAAEEEGGGLGIAVSNFRASGARLLYDDRQTVQSAELGFDVQLSAVPGEAPGSIDSQGTLEMSTLRSVADGDTTALQNATVRYDVLADLNAGRIDLRDLSLETPPLALATTGAVTRLNGARPVVDLSIETTRADLAQLAAIVPGGVGEGVSPRGTMTLSVTAQGPLPDSTGAADSLQVQGTGRLDGVGVDVDGTTMLSDLGADLSVSLDSLSLASIEGALLGKPLSGRIAVADLLGEPSVDGQLAGAADLARLSTLAAEEGSEPVKIGGSADYDVRFAGPATDPDGIRVRGPIQLSGVRLPNESTREPVEIESATIELTGSGLRADRFGIRSGEQAMQLQFAVRDLLPVSRGLAETNPAMRVDFAFRADRLDLIELFPEEDASEPLYSDLFTAQLAGTTVNGRSPEEVAAEMYGDVELPAFAVDGDVQIGTLLNEPQRYDDLSFDVQMRGRRLEVRNLSAATYGGSLAGSLTLDQSEAAASAYVRPAGRSVWMASAGGGVAPKARVAVPMPETPTALTYDFKLEDAKASAFLEDWTRLGQAVSGTMNLNISGDSPLSEGFLPVAQALQATGRSVVSGGGFSAGFNLPQQLVSRLGVSKPSMTDFKRFGGPFTIEEGELRMGEWSMQGSQVQTTMSGALGLGGTVDLDLTAQMPLSMVRGSKLAQGGAISKMLSRLGGKDDRVPVTVGVGGTMSDPTFQVDSSALESAVKELLPRGIRGLID